MVLRCRYKKMRAGVTLLELLLVMAILVIVGAVGFTFFFGFRLSVELEEEENRMAEALREAKGKATAIEQGYQWGVRFDNVVSTAAFFTVFAGQSYAGSSTTTSYYLASGIEYQSPAAGSASEVLFSKRAATTTAATITIRLKNKPTETQTIIVSTQGLISK